MNQSNDPPAPCADKGGHGKATTSVCDDRSGAHRQKNGNLATVTIVAPPTGKRKRNSWVWKVMQQFEPPIRKWSVRYSVEVSKYRGQNVEAYLCSVSLPGFWLRKSECGATGSSLSSTPCSSLPRGRGDHLPSGAQFFFPVVFDWHLSGKHESVIGGTNDASEVEPGMPTGGSKVQRRHCCAARKTQPMPPGCAIGTRGGCWGDGRCRYIEALTKR